MKEKEGVCLFLVCAETGKVVSQEMGFIYLNGVWLLSTKDI